MPESIDDDSRVIAVADARSRTGAGGARAGVIDEQIYAAWVDALKALTGTPAQAQAFQEHRFRVAHRLRTALLADERLGAAPLLYGVELETAGWVYVGQTQNGQRRLR